jgi:hypothetical protein
VLLKVSVKERVENEAIKKGDRSFDCPLLIMRFLGFVYLDAITNFLVIILPADSTVIKYAPEGKPEV